MNSSNRGSEWRKWDLHFHTPSSYDYKDKSITNEKIIEVLKEKGISVIAITDHHFIDVPRILELQRLGKISDITILPGIEFRAELGGSESIHYIGIFSEKLESQQLQDIWIKLQSNCKITQTEIQNIGGDANIQCDFKETSKLIHELGGIVTVHAGTKANTFENITNSLPDKMAQKAILVKGFIDVFELGKETDQINYNNIVFPNLGFRLPMIICSDNHKITDYIVKQNLWIKANPTFEGLKQIIHEPTERVKIQNEQPESEKLDHLMIEEVSFESSGNKFTLEPIKLNKNLNVIIGGKSSGKSILLYKIARTLYAETKSKALKYIDSDDGDEKDLYDLSNDDANFNFNVKLFSGSRQSLRDRHKTASILPGIKYIPQNHLSNLVDRSRKNGKTLKELIRNLILEDPSCKKKYVDFVDEAKRNDTQRSQDIDFYFTLKNDLIKKKEELLTKGDMKSLEEGIDFNKQKIIGLNKDFTEQEQILYAELTEKLNSLRIRENQVSADFEKLNTFQIDFHRFIVEYSNKKKLTLDSLQTESIKTEYSGKLQFVDNVLTSINEVSKDFSKIEQNEFIENTIFANEMNIIRTETIRVNDDLKQYNDKLENQKQVEALQKSISIDEAKIADIVQFNKEINLTKVSISSQKEKIFRDFKVNFSLYEKIISDLQPRISSIEGETDKIEILPSVKYNFPKFRELADNIFDKRGFNNQGFDDLYQYWNKNPKSALSDFKYEEIEKSIKLVFEKIEKKQLIPKGGNSEKEACKKIMTDYFFDHWDVKSDDDDIHKMSTGKASFVLLKLIIKLSNENGPILIDQPEDNLDNRSVSKELVRFLKEKKKDRQIILVTHNPNIVVNADAENIIVANQEGQNNTETSSIYRFDYINGALENAFEVIDTEKDLLKSMGIREHIADIVEGGKEAFQKREEKYGF